MLINNITVSDRNTDPPVLSKVGLRLFFLQDGNYFDPYQISSVSIFKASDNYSPSTVLNTDELIASSVSSNILMNFSNSSPLTSNQSFNVSNYGGNGEYGIFRLNQGEYVVILDGINEQEGYLNLYGINQTIPNAVSTIGDYMDVWTVKMVEGSELETIFNYFTLTTGNFQTITEPIMFRVRNRLLNNSIVLGSKVDIKINSEITVESTISEETKNTLKNYIVRNASIEIVKLNNETNLPARVVVSSFEDTSSLTKVATNNLITFTWDTELLKTHPEAYEGNLAGIKGTYYVQAKFNLFNERIISPPMHLTVE